MFKVLLDILSRDKSCKNKYDCIHEKNNTILYIEIFIHQNSKFKKCTLNGLCMFFFFFIKVHLFLVIRNPTLQLENCIGCRCRNTCTAILNHSISFYLVRLFNWIVWNFSAWVGDLRFNRRCVFFYLLQMACFFHIIWASKCLASFYTIISTRCLSLSVRILCSPPPWL